MKARIIDNQYANTFPDDFFDKYWNQIINGQLVSEWQTTTVLPSENIVKPIWNGTTWIESQTAEEKAEIALQNETRAYEKRSADGQTAYAKISAEFRLAKLAGVITEEAHGFIESQLIAVRNEILAGQWKSGLKELESLGATTIGQTLYDRLHLQLSTYITLNY